MSTSWPWNSSQNLLWPTEQLRSGRALLRQDLRDLAYCCLLFPTSDPTVRCTCSAWPAASKKKNSLITWPPASHQMDEKARLIGRASSRQVNSINIYGLFFFLFCYYWVLNLFIEHQLVSKERESVVSVWYL